MTLITRVLTALALLLVYLSAQSSVFAEEFDEMESGGAPLDETVDSKAPTGRSVVHFESDGKQLEAYLYRPEGPGPFPVIVWNHGSERNPSGSPVIGKFAMKHGFVMLAASRRGHGHSQGNYMKDALQSAKKGQQRQRRMVELQDQEAVDVDESIGYAKSLKFVDKRNIYVFGCSYGGIQTLLAAERNPHIKGAVAFAPGAMSWEGNPYLRDRLVAAVRAKRVPTFILQAANDFSLGPSRVLGPIVERSGAPSRSKIYAAHGTTHEQGHGGFCSRATDEWGADVLDFLQRTRVK